jgi:large subunit ribosomal protein L18
MQRAIDRSAIRRRIRYRVRKKIVGTAARPRIAVFRSSKHIYAQVIDDGAGRTLAQASTADKEIRGKISGSGNIAAATAVGETIAERLKSSGIESVVFDRGGYLYHGRVKALADGIRSAGVKI